MIADSTVHLSTPHPLRTLFGAYTVDCRFWGCKISTMRNAIGLLIMLWGFSQFFSTSFAALDGAARESFNLIEVSAVTSQQKIIEQSQP